VIFLTISFPPYFMGSELHAVSEDLVVWLKLDGPNIKKF
jgi:hypothetical protein